MPAITAIFGADTTRLDAAYAKELQIANSYSKAVEAGSLKVAAINKAATEQSKAAMASNFAVSNAYFEKEAAAYIALKESEAATAKVAQLANAEKVAANRAALDSIMAKEAEEATFQQMMMDKEVEATAKAAAEKAAINRASNLASITDVAKGGGVNSGLFGGHGSGGASGVVRETFVLIREALRGNWTRMLGSLTLMAQYTGTLGKVLKTTAAAAIENAAAQNKVAAAYARAALGAEAKYRAAVRDAEASGLSAEEAVIASAAYRKQADSAIAASVAMNEKAAAAAESAEIEAAAATVSLGPIGWIAAAIIALGVALYAGIKLWKRHEEAVREAGIVAGTIAPSLKEQQKAFETAQNAMQDYIKTVEEATSKVATLREQMDLETKAIEDQDEAVATLTQVNQEQAMADIDLAEKTGKITAKQAIDARAKAKTDAEVQNIEQKGIELHSISSTETNATADAQNKSARAQTDYLKATQDAADSKEAQARNARIAQLQDFIKGGGNSSAKFAGKVLGYNVDTATQELGKLTAQQKGLDAAVATSRENFTQAATQANDMKKTSDEATKKSSDYDAGMNALIAARKKLIETQRQGEQADLANQQKKETNQDTSQGRQISLNSQQRIGAYARTPPDWQQVARHVGEIAKNTAPSKSSGLPTGSKPAQFNGKSAHYDAKRHVSYSR